MISVAEARAILQGLVRPLPTEIIHLSQGLDRVLADPVTALRDQPPFPTSVMDGYAVASARPGEQKHMIGESAAGHRFDGHVGPQDAVRIFTGAVVPQGATRVVIQEDVTRANDTITLAENLDTPSYIRPSGADFKAGATFEAPRKLTPSDLALLASMNVPTLPVFRKPIVAIISTGDELVMPGEAPSSDQIIASNGIGIAALLQKAGAETRVLPIAKDTAQSLKLTFSLAADADMIVTIGGASVGDHDLVQNVAKSEGLELEFYKIAMRPGKPLMAGRLRGTPFIGLPGNPVSSMVCAAIFMLPLIEAMQGLSPSSNLLKGRLSHGLPKNGQREHYMRARLDDGQVTVADQQDSGLLTILAQSNCLVKRPPNAPPIEAGEDVELLML